MVTRLTLPHAAAIERRRHRQRGGDRVPGTRAGVFRQKITNAERVLAAVLYQRRLCTRQVLADLFEVSPRTIGNALTEVTPLLEQHGYAAKPATMKFSTAASLLASITTPCP